MTTPLERELAVSEGVVRFVCVSMAPGCQRTTGVQIYFQGVQKWPQVEHEWIRLDATPWMVEENFRVDSAPRVFKIYAYNEDTVNAHEVVVGILVLREEEIGLLQQIVTALTPRRARRG